MRKESVVARTVLLWRVNKCGQNGKWFGEELK